MRGGSFTRGSSAVLTLFTSGFSLYELSRQHNPDATRYGLGRLDSRSVPVAGPNALLLKRKYMNGQNTATECCFGLYNREQRRNLNCRVGSSTLITDCRVGSATKLEL
jgi:hypothetical protein